MLRFGSEGEQTLLGLLVLEVGLLERVSRRGELDVCKRLTLGFVGHVIGLGDRHGSNILVDQLTWGALHIDFGDVCHPLIPFHHIAPIVRCEQ